MKSIQCIAVSSLPGGIPVAVTDRDGVVLVYLSEEHELETIAEALTLVATHTRAEVISLR